MTELFGFCWSIKLIPTPATRGAPLGGGRCSLTCGSCNPDHSPESSGHAWAGQSSPRQTEARCEKICQLHISSTPPTRHFQRVFVCPCEKRLTSQLSLTSFFFAMRKSCRSHRIAIFWLLIEVTALHSAAMSGHTDTVKAGGHWPSGRQQQALIQRVLRTALVMGSCLALPGAAVVSGRPHSATVGRALARSA